MPSPLVQLDAQSDCYSGGRGFGFRVRPHIFRRDVSTVTAMIQVGQSSVSGEGIALCTV